MLKNNSNLSKSLVIKNQFQESLEYLVGKGADPDIANDEGKTPRSLVPLEKRGMLDLGSSSPIKLSAVMELTTGK